MASLTRANRELYRRYEARARDTPGVTFVGRLARYQYLNMDQVVASALQAFEAFAARCGSPGDAGGARAAA